MNFTWGVGVGGGMCVGRERRGRHIKIWILVDCFIRLFYLVSHAMYHSCGVLPHRTDRIMVQMRSLWFIAARTGLCLHCVCANCFFTVSCMGRFVAQCCSQEWMIRNSNYFCLLCVFLLILKHFQNITPQIFVVDSTHDCFGIVRHMHLVMNKSSEWLSLFLMCTNVLSLCTCFWCVQMYSLCTCFWCVQMYCFCVHVFDVYKCIVFVYMFLMCTNVLSLCTCFWCVQCIVFVYTLPGVCMVRLLSKPVFLYACIKLFMHSAVTCYYNILIDPCWEA